MSDVVEFLRARLDAEAEEIEASRLDNEPEWWMPSWVTRDRLLAEVKAKRAIEYLHRPAWIEGRNLDGDEREGWWCTECCEVAPCVTFRYLAAVYADHPDYRQEWAL